MEVVFHYLCYYFFLPSLSVSASVCLSVCLSVSVSLSCLSLICLTLSHSLSLPHSPSLPLPHLSPSLSRSLFNTFWQFLVFVDGFRSIRIRYAKLCKEGGYIHVAFTVLLLLSFVISCCAAPCCQTYAKQVFELLIENTVGTQAVNNLESTFSVVVCCVPLLIQIFPV